MGIKCLGFLPKHGEVMKGPQKGSTWEGLWVDSWGGGGRGGTGRFKGHVGGRVARLGYQFEVGPREGEKEAWGTSGL